MSIGKKFYVNYGLSIQQTFMEPLKVINMNTQQNGNWTYEKIKINISCVLKLELFINAQTCMTI